MDLCDLARSNMALYLDVMSTDSGLQFAWGEISRYLSKDIEDTEIFVQQQILIIAKKTKK